MKFLMTVIAAAATIASVPAAAVSVVGATRIEIKSALPDYLQVAEVQAFNFASTNVALTANGGSATGSSTYSGFSTPDKAIDGNTAGNYYMDTIFHSAGSGGGESLDVNFGPTTLSSLSIFGRSDCCSQRDVYSVTVFNAAGATLFSGQIDANNGAHSGTFTFDAPGTVPEPASWVMMIAGFGLVGFAARRRVIAVAS